jgi:hypothetical protein
MWWATAVKRSGSSAMMECWSERLAQRFRLFQSFKPFNRCAPFKLLFPPLRRGDMKEGVEPPEQLEQLDASGVKEVGR